MHTIESLSEKHPGHVIKRMLIDGKHSKMRIVGTERIRTCHACEKKFRGKAVKIETTGNMTIMVQCIPCTVEELNNE